DPATRFDLALNFITTTQSSYAAVVGLSEVLIYRYNPGTNDDRCQALDSEGIFGVNIAYRMSTVTDWTSNTMMLGEVDRFKNEPAGSNFNFVNVAGWFIGPPWTSSTPAWNDTRITAFAYPVPKLNSPPMLNIGGGVPPCIASTDPRISRTPN